MFQKVSQKERLRAFSLLLVSCLSKSKQVNIGYEESMAISTLINSLMMLKE